MDQVLVKRFQEAIADVEQLAPEDFLNLSREALQTLRTLQSQLASADPELRDHLLGDAMELRHNLETLLVDLIAATGMTEDQITQFVETPSNFPEDEWEVITLASRELSELHDLLQQFLGTPTRRVKTHGQQKGWISS